jgi:hypothetical protein
MLAQFGREHNLDYLSKRLRSRSPAIVTPMSPTAAR